MLLSFKLKVKIGLRNFPDGILNHLKDKQNLICNQVAIVEYYLTIISRQEKSIAEYQGIFYDSWKFS